MQFLAPATYYRTKALGTINPIRITLTNNAQNTYTVVVKATNVIGTVSSATSGAMTTQSAVPVPGLSVVVQLGMAVVQK